MTNEEYNQQKEAIIKAHGVPEYDLREPVNESAKLLVQLAARKREETRSVKKEEQDEETSGVNYKEDRPWKRAKYQKLPAVVILDKDLKGFTETESNIIKTWFLDRSLSSQQLGHQFGKPYQFVAALFKRPEFKLLKMRYFEEELGGATQEAILQMVRNGNPNVVQAASVYVGLMQEKNNKDNENKLVNPQHEIYLSKLAEWLMDESQDTLVLKKQNGIDRAVKSI